jgi:ABC-2 type transport system ATP-binding protein
VKGRKKKESERTTGPTEVFVFSGPDAFGGSKMENGVIIAIAVEGLAKRFGDVQAVADASFEVRRGELFGFLGPNGAGKTTTIRIAGIDCTRNPKAAQHLIGVIPDESNLYPELTGVENLGFCAALYGMPKGEREARAHDLLETFGLAKAAGRKFAGYSKGMKRKLTIAAGIIHSPPILFLDEPTTGIDVASARQIRQIIADLNRSGTTVFLTTHYIEEAERLTGRIAFIVNGRIVRIDTVENLIEPIREKHVMQLSVSNDEKTAPDKLAAVFPQLAFRNLSSGQVRVESSEPVHVGPLVRFLEEQGVEVMEARKMRPSLEEVFVQITGIETVAMRKEKEKAGGGA